MRFIPLLSLLASLGCHNDLLLPDGSTDAVALDAAASCPTPAQPLIPGRSKVYLNTEGVTLRKVGMGCTTNNAQTNCTDLIAQDQTVVPPFLAGVATRQQYIDQLVTMVQGVFAPYSLDIVTTRPATGNYLMVVLGGDSMSITGGCPSCTAVSDFSCAPLVNVVDLMFDFGMTAPTTLAGYANTMIDDLGVLSGLSPTTQPGDCMCRADTQCFSGGSPSTVCTFGTNEQTSMMKIDGTNTPVNCGRTSEDEPALLKTTFGCR